MDTCQITGGRFSMADEVLVNVIGIAEPERGDDGGDDGAVPEALGG